MTAGSGVAMRSEASPVAIGYSRRSTAAVRARAGGQLVGLLGPGPGRRALDTRVRRTLDDAITTLDRDGASEATKVLTDFAASAEDAIRRHDERGGVDARITFAAALVRGDKLWLARTGYASVALVRDGVLTVLDAPTEHEPSGWRTWLGAPEPDAERDPIPLDLLPEALQLRPGDRLVLCTHAMRSLSRLSLQTLICTGPMHLAVEALARALSADLVTDDLSVVMVTCGEVAEHGEALSTFDPEGLDALGELFQHAG